MGIVILFSLIYILFIIFELVPMFKSKQYKEVIAYGLIMSVAYFMQMVDIAGFSSANVRAVVAGIIDYISM